MLDRYYQKSDCSSKLNQSMAPDNNVCWLLKGAVSVG